VKRGYPARELIYVLGQNIKLLYQGQTPEGTQELLALWLRSKAVGLDPGTSLRTLVVFPPGIDERIMSRFKFSKDSFLLSQDAWYLLFRGSIKA